jgi:uncharacterized repeat protein (TIGR03843 family)
MPTDKRPPSSDGVSGWSPDSGHGLEGATELLATSGLTVLGRLPWSSNLTYLVRLDESGDDPLNAVYKPAGGERSLWDFPDGLYRREVAAFALSEALGWGLVPPTVLREDGPFGEGSLQLFVQADYEQHYFTLYEEDGHEHVLQTMCAFDVVANNADRKSGHVLKGPDGRLWGIDHGLCFHRQPKLRTVIWDFAEDPIPEDILADLAGVAAELPHEVAGLLSGAEGDSIRHRARHLGETGTFPEPLGDRPPYPWPLV